MINIVLLIAGNGKRFSEAGYELPKPLLPVKYNGLTERMYKMVLLNTLKNIDLSIVASITIVSKTEYIKDPDSEIDSICNFINFFFANIIPVRFLFNDDLKGALDAALTIENLNLKGSLLILNCDQLIEFSEENFRSIYELTSADEGILFHFKEAEESNKWGYSVIEKGFVKSIHEKQPVSEYAHTGHYFFNSIENFISDAKAVIERDIKVNGEYFLSPVYNLMIKEHVKVILFMVDSFIGLGTPEDYQRYMESVK